MIGKSCVSEFVYNWLEETMYPYRSFLEIGTYDGVTVSKLAANYPNKDFTVVDDFSEGHFDIFKKNTENLNNITLIKEDSKKALKMLIDEGKMFDLIFIDGGHEYECVVEDFLNSYELCSGIISMHDRKYVGVHKAIRHVCQEKYLAEHIMDDFLSWFEEANIGG